MAAQEILLPLLSLSLTLQPPFIYFLKTNRKIKFLTDVGGGGTGTKWSGTRLVVVVVSNGFVVVVVAWLHFYFSVVSD